MNQCVVSEDAEEPPSAPYVSVVVPFYNVEDCVADCLASLVIQTFTNFEVICVDDGSTDFTGYLLDALTAEFAQFHVIHIEHSGLSVARNCGVSIARGVLISFVDGDDFVSPWYLQALVAAYGDATNGFVRANCIVGSRTKLLSKPWPAIDAGSFGTIKAAGRHAALRDYLIGRTGSTAWGCLAPRKLYLDIPFEQGILYEDTYSHPFHLAAIDEFKLIPIALYGHVTRNGSIAHPHIMSEKHITDLLLSADSARDLKRALPCDLHHLLAWRNSGIHACALGMVQSLPDAEQRTYWTTTLRDQLLADLPAVIKITEQEKLPIIRLIQVLLSIACPPAACTARRLWRKYIQSKVKTS